jgi:hypothetical protein
MIRTTAILAGVATVSAVTLAAHAFAAGESAIVPSYTGCLNAGKLQSIAPGDTPLAPCGATQQQVRLSGGDITSVSAGTGMTGGGQEGDVTLGVDPATVQSRVKSQCLTGPRGPIDASISAIHQDGTVTCNQDDKGASTDVFAGFWDGSIQLPPSPPLGLTMKPLAKLPLPAGKYAISATLDINDQSAVEGFVTCTLTAGIDFDKTQKILAPEVTSNEPDVGSLDRVALQVVHEFRQPDAAIISCGASDLLGTGSVTASFMKITATRVANLTNGPLTVLP